MRSLLSVSLLCALILIVVSSSADDGSADYELAVFYESGNDSIAPDLAKSLYLYRRAARKGNVEAQNYLGFLYYRGRGTERNVDSSLYWIRKAAEAGDIKAAGNMGYFLSVAPDVEHDYTEAFKWLTKAADAGLPTSFTQLADLYRKGAGTPPDTARAIELYEKGIRSGIADAQYRLLAMMGFVWKELSADSALNEGIRYYKEGAPVVAADLFETSAQKGNVMALAWLGDLYSRGVGVEYSHDKANRYYLEAALLGDPSAQFILGEALEIFPDLIDEELLEEALRKIKDRETVSSIAEEDFKVLTSATYWFEKAALQGVKDAESAYKRLLEGDRIYQE